MFKFGAEPVRSLKSFGVAGLLQEECHIFYDNLFSTHHVGRVSDLLSARLKKAGIDELDFRSLLTLVVFTSYRNQAGKKKVVGNAEDQYQFEILEEPVTMECGIDSEKIAIGVAFEWNEKSKFTLEGLKDRLNSGKTEDVLENLVLKLKRISDRLVVRYQPTTKRLETVSLIGLEGKTQKLQEGESSVEIVEIPKEAEKAPRAKFYEELGDLDYPKLLKDHSPSVHNQKGTSAGKLLADAAREGAAASRRVPSKEDQALADALRARGKEGQKDESEKVSGKGDGSESGQKVAGSPDEKDGNQRVSGGGSEEDGNQKVKGSKEEINDKNKVKGGKEDLNDDVTKVRGQGGIEDEEVKKLISSDVTEEDLVQLVSDPEKLKDEAIKLLGKQEKLAEVVQEMGSKEKVYESQIQELQEKVASLEALLDEKGMKKVSGLSENEEDEDDDEDEDDEDSVIDKGKKVVGFIKDLWKSKVKGEDEEEESDGKSTKKKAKKKSDESDPEEGSNESGSGAKGSEEELDPNLADPNFYTRTLINSVESGDFHQAVSKAERDADDLKAEVNSDRGKKIVDGIMQDLLAEKARVKELVKKIGGSVRQKEIEFRNREQALKEELRRRDENIKQRDKVLTRTKDQLTQASMNLERMKNSASKVAGDGSTHFKKKLAFTQSLLDKSKEENSNLKKKLESFKSNLNTMRNQMQSVMDQKALKEKYDDLRRQFEEMKRGSGSLKEQLSESEKRNQIGEKEMEKTKKKLDAAMKIAAEKKKEAEWNNEKLEKMELETIELKMKIQEYEIRIREIEEKDSGDDSSAA